MLREAKRTGNLENKQNKDRPQTSGSGYNMLSQMSLPILRLSCHETPEKDWDCVVEIPGREAAAKKVLPSQEEKSLRPHLTRTLPPRGANHINPAQDIVPQLSGLPLYTIIPKCLHAS